MSGPCQEALAGDLDMVTDVVLIWSSVRPDRRLAPQGLISKVLRISQAFENLQPKSPTIQETPGIQVTFPAFCLHIHEIKGGLQPEPESAIT